MGRRFLAVLGPILAVVASTLSGGVAVAARPVVEVAAGDAFACARTDDGDVWCWGDGHYGAVGDDTSDVTWIPHHVKLPEPATAIDASMHRACAVTRSGAAWCWGAAYLGDGTDYEWWVPVRVASTTDAIDVSVSQTGTCLLGDDTRVSCWGVMSGLVGDGSVQDVPSPVSVDGLDGVTALSTGLINTCVLAAGGATRCWGSYGHEPGAGPLRLVKSTTPIEPYPLPPSIDVSTQKQNPYDCVLDENASVACWGDAGFCGESTRWIDTPTAVPVDDVARLVSGACSTCAIRYDRSLICWGNNAVALGWRWPDGRPEDWREPHEVVGIGPVVDAAVGGQFGCAVIEDGGVMCWGMDALGQLGDGQGWGATGPYPPRFIHLDLH